MARLKPAQKRQGDRGGAPSEDREQSAKDTRPLETPETRPRRSFSGFDRERLTYQRIKSQLLETAEGKFVVIVGEEWDGPLETSEQAEKAGYKKFGLGPLYITQVLAEEPSPVLMTHDVAICRP